MPDSDWVAEMLSEISRVAGPMSEQERLLLLDFAIEAAVLKAAANVTRSQASEGAQKLHSTTRYYQPAHPNFEDARSLH